MRRDHGHSRSDACHLALHRAALAKLHGHPELRTPCLDLLKYWRDKQLASGSEPYLEQWADMLEHWSDDQLEGLILDEVKGQALRQCSPLGPLFTAQERSEILERTNQALREQET